MVQCIWTFWHSLFAYFLLGGSLVPVLHKNLHTRSTVSSQCFAFLIKIIATFFPPLCVFVSELEREKCVLFWSADIALRSRFRQHSPFLSSLLFFSLRDLSCRILRISSETMVTKSHWLVLGLFLSIMTPQFFPSGLPLHLAWSYHRKSSTMMQRDILRFLYSVHCHGTNHLYCKHPFTVCTSHFSWSNKCFFWVGSLEIVAAGKYWGHKCVDVSHEHFVVYSVHYHLI